MKTMLEHLIFKKPVKRRTTFNSTSLRENIGFYKRFNNMSSKAIPVRHLPASICNVASIATKPTVRPVWYTAGLSNTMFTG